MQMYVQMCVCVCVYDVCESVCVRVGVCAAKQEEWQRYKTVTPVIAELQ